MSDWQPVHGKLVTYNAGCRCEPCVAAYRAYTQRPETKARMRVYAQKPEVKAKHRARARAYAQRMRRLAQLAIAAGLDKPESES